MGSAALVTASALAVTGCGGGGEVVDTAAVKASPATSAAASSSAPAPSGAPTLSDQTGRTINRAIAAADGKGLEYAVYLEGTGLTLDGGGEQASSWGAGEEVCEQIDDPDDVNDSYDVAFTVPRDGRDCDGRLLHTPEPTRTPATGDGNGSGGSSGGSTGSTGGSTGGSGGKTGCAITSPAGNCYADGQFCANRHHGLSTYGRGGEYLTCAQDGAGRWRWSDGVAG